MASNEKDETAAGVPKAAALVAANLRRQIIRGDLVDGDGLPAEHLLTEQYQVSRPILREAYRILESERLIEVRRGPKGGARVRKPDAAVAAGHVGLMLQFEKTSLADVYAARRALESPAAALVAGAHDDGGLVLLRADLGAAAARDFHATIVALGGNNSLTLFHSILDELLDQVRDASTSSPEACHRTHQLVYELVVRGDVAAVDELWRDHLDDVAKGMDEVAGDAVIDLLG